MYITCIFNSILYSRLYIMCRLYNTILNWIEYLGLASFNTIIMKNTFIENESMNKYFLFISNYKIMKIELRMAYLHIKYMFNWNYAKSFTPSNPNYPRWIWKINKWLETVPFCWILNKLYFKLQRLLKLPLFLDIRNASLCRSF